MFFYRGYEVQEEITCDFVPGGSRKRGREYQADVKMQILKAKSEEDICDKIDEILGSGPGGGPSK